MSALKTKKRETFLKFLLTLTLSVKLYIILSILFNHFEYYIYKLFPIFMKIGLYFHIFSFFFGCLSETKVLEFKHIFQI